MTATPVPMLVDFAAKGKGIRISKWKLRSGAEPMPFNRLSIDSLITVHDGFEAGALGLYSIMNQTRSIFDDCAAYDLLTKHMEVLEGL